MNKQILFIEDEENYRHSIKYLFNGSSCRFIEATSPEEGIAQLEANPDVRVVLLDLSFAEAHGTAVLEYLKSRSDDYRVIVLTGHGELLAAEQAGNYEVFTYLPKAEGPSDQAIRFSVEQAFKDLERQHLQRKLRYLLDVQTKINEQAPVEEVLDLICQSVRATVGAYTCHVRVYDFACGDFHLKGFSGPDEGMRQIFEQPRAKGDLFSGRVVESGIKEVIPDLQSKAEFREFAAKALDGREVSPEAERYWRGVRSAYIVPISTGLSGSLVDAVLNVSSDVPAFFDDAKCALVDEFVTQAALAVTKDWLQRKREEIHKDYTNISQMLGEMTDRLNGKDVLGEIYQVVTRRISEIVRPEVVSIFLFNETTGLVENVAELRGTEIIDASDEAYRPGQSFTGWVYRHDTTLHLPKPGDPRRLKPLEDDRYDRINEKEYLKRIPSGDLKHYLGVPIRIGGKIRGVLRAMNKKSDYYDGDGTCHDRLCLLDRGFSFDCKNVMEITARHLAVAIRNAELLREKQRQVEQVQTLGEVSRLLNSALELDDLLKLTLEKTAEVMKAEICMLFLKEGENEIVLKQCLGMPLIPASYKIGEGVTGQVAKTGKPTYRKSRNNGKYDEKIRAYLCRKHGRFTSIESLMAVPIVAKDTVLGAMKVINKVGDPGGYNEKDLELFSTFAAYVGVAVENAQIYKITNERLAIAERNATLSVLVSAVAHETNNTSGLIPAAVGELREELGALSESVASMLDLIEDEATQATDFANDIAGFSVKHRAERQVLDVNEVVQSAVRALKVEGNGLHWALSERPLMCGIYRTPFTQIVRNIVINAIQALDGREGGWVRVTTSEGADKWSGFAVVELADNGPGVDAQPLEKIFEPDFTTKPKGNGIGLWLVRTQLEQIGGRIDVESEAGKGARFIVRIPLARSEGEQADGDAHASAAH